MRENSKEAARCSFPLAACDLSSSQIVYQNSAPTKHLLGVNVDADARLSGVVAIGLDELLLAGLAHGAVIVRATHLDADAQVTLAEVAGALVVVRASLPCGS